MRIVVRPAGRHALLVEVADPATVPDLAARLTAAGGGIEVVPAATTVLVSTDGDLDTVRALIHRVAAAPAAGPEVTGSARGEVAIPVHYDGPDLDDLTALTGLTRAEIVAAHTGQPWRAAFTGFMPGFCYLVGGDPRLEVPRRPQSRPRVPAGAVALAGGYSGVYPAASPGGWQLLGTTDRVLWDLTADPPALVRPGDRVRFVDVEAPGGDVAAAAGRPGDHPRRGATGTVTAAPVRDGRDGVGVARALVVVSPGPMSLLQDDGRRGWAHVGVGRSGAADRASYRRANALVGNPGSGVAVEVTFGGLTVEARGDLVVAVTGAPAPLTVDGRPAAHGRALLLPHGTRLTLRTPPTGLRSYLAVAGGIDVPLVLGSASTDLLSGLGPAPVRRGDVLPVGLPGGPGTAVAGSVDTGLAAASSDPLPSTSVAKETVPAGGTLVLTVTAGPRDDRFTDASVLATGEWVVSPQSNRVGLRLDRADGAPGLVARDAAELPSEGVVTGAVQVPPGGQPVLFLADHPVTGGYPVVAVVDLTDVDRAAQARPGGRIRFRFAGP